MSLKNKIIILSKKLIKDDRGWFLKVIEGNEKYLPKSTGEIYFTNAKPGQSRGGHYHKIANEWFSIINGQCTLELIDVLTEEKLTLSLSDKLPQTVFVPNNIAHKFINTSDKEFLLMAYTDLIYDPTDTIPFEF